MRPARHLARAALFVLFAFIALPASGEGRDHPEFAGVRDATVAGLEAAALSGELTWEAAARQKLLYIFDRAAMEARYDLSEGRPARCATLILAEIGANLGRLDAATRALYEERVGGGPRTDALLVYETAHFYIEYNTTGTHVVTLTDVSPANGVPDFVEETGASCELSWTVEVTNLGFTAPPLPGPNGKYLIQFQTQGSYGFTTTVIGGTKIVLHPNYVGFPPNDDPDGDILGALRATVAHEFKHASQNAASGWSEGGWVELDATWVEDIVYDVVDDYYNYIASSGSPFTQPQVSLDSGGSGSYEDCNWQHYLSETFGNAHIVGLWQRRITNPGETMLASYSNRLTAAGSSFAAAWGEYVAWNFACGTRAAAGYGYGEAADYPTTPATTTHTALPIATTNGSVPHLAANTRLVSNASGSLSGTPEFTFTGQGTGTWSVSVLTRDRSGVITRTPMTLTAGAGTLLLTGVNYGELEWAALVIGNATLTGSHTYSFSARSLTPVLIAHDPLWDTENAATPYPVLALVTDADETVNASAISLDYRVNGDGLTNLPMTATGTPNQYSADIPAQNVGTLLEYRINAAGSLGGTVVSPSFAGGFHAFTVVTEFEPFEALGAFTVGDAGDAATSGVWERAIPVGTIAAPAADFTPSPGQYCYVTQNGVVGGADGAADVDGGKTTLRSPVYDLAPGGPYTSAVVRYRRWYSNHLGAAVDDSWRADVSNDGGASWTPVENTTVGVNGWVEVNVDLIATFGTPGQVRLRWIADDSGAGSLVEAGVDEFEIIAVPQPNVSVGDRRGSGLALGAARPNPSRGAVAMALTLPGAARVSAVVRDVTGRTVRTLVSDAAWESGAHAIEWDGRGEDGRSLRAGVYFIQVRAGAETVRQRVAVVK